MHWLSLETEVEQRPYMYSPCLEESRLIHKWAALSCSALQKRKSGPALVWHNTKCQGMNQQLLPPCPWPQTTLESHRSFQYNVVEAEGPHQGGTCQVEEKKLLSLLWKGLSSHHLGDPILLRQEHHGRAWQSYFLLLHYLPFLKTQVSYVHNWILEHLSLHLNFSSALQPRTTYQPSVVLFGNFTF